MLSRAYDKAKGVAGSAWTGFKKYFFPTSTSAGRLISSGGGVILNAESLADRGYQAVTGNNTQAPSSVRIPVQVFFVTTSVMVTSATRILPTFRFFSEPDSDFRLADEAPAEPINALSHDIHDDNVNLSRYPDWTQDEFSAGWNGLLIYIRLMLYTSLVFNFNSSVFSGIKIYELMAQIIAGGGNLNLSTVAIVFEVFFSLYIAYCNAATFYSLNIPISLQNVIDQIKDIKKNGITYDKTSALVHAISLFAISASVFGAYYTTENAFLKYKAMNSFVDNLISRELAKLITIISMTSTVVAESSSKPFSLRRLIDKYAMKARNLKNRCFGTPEDIEQAPLPEENIQLPGFWLKFKIATIMAGVCDSSGAGALNYSSIPYTMHALFSDIPLDSPYLQAFKIGSAASTAILGFAFTFDGIENTEKILVENAKSKARSDELKRIVIEDNSDDDNDDVARPLLALPQKAELTLFGAPKPPNEKRSAQDKFFDSDKRASRSEGRSRFVLDSSESSSDSESGFIKSMNKTGGRYKL